MQGILGPTSIERWLEGHVRFVKVWARGVFGAGATGQAPLTLFSRKQDDDDLPIIPAALGPLVAMEEIDSALTRDNQAPEVPFTATHCGIYIEPLCVVGLFGTDVSAVLADIQVICARTWVEIYFGDQKEPFDRGLISEFPAGYGLEVEGFSTAGAVTMAQFRNGPAVPGVVHALPTAYRVTEDTTLRVKLIPTHGGFTPTAAHGIRFTTYGVKGR